MSSGRRVNGCQRPFSFVQVSAWVCQVIVICWFAIVAFGFLANSGPPIVISSVIWCVLLAISLCCWFWCQLADPAKVGTSCIVLKEHDSHYCAVCKKSVPGIDHHAGLLFIWQIIVLALLMSVWRSPLVKQRAIDVFDEPDVGFYIVSGIGILMSAPIAWFYSALFGFHTYLVARGMTTYGYFIERSEIARKKRAEKAIKEKLAAGAKNTDITAAKTRNSTDIGVV